MTDRKTLGERFPIEQARVREVLAAYKEIGPPGAFASAMIEQALQRADEAVIRGDLAEMIMAYKELQTFDT